MNTTELINWIRSRTGFQGTTEEIRVLVNVAQNEIFSYNTYFNRKKPESACTIDTEQTVLQYSIPDVNVRQVARVYVIDGYGDKVDIPVEVQEAIEPGESVTLFFKEDQGDTTGEIYYEGYLWPPNGQISSQTVPMSIPEKVQTGLLFYMVSEMLEVDKDGRSIYNEEEKQKRLRDYFTFANQGADLEPTYPSPLGC
jgi:hypothetical protein